MKENIFQTGLAVIAALFTICFLILVVPPLVQNFDPIGAFAGGFVNPFSSGYALDVIFTWLALALWVFYESKTKGIKHGWIALALGVVPGVAVGLAFYIYIRSVSLEKNVR